MRKVWLELKYDAGTAAPVVAVIETPRILHLVKAFLIARQEAIARKAKEVDELLAMEEERELDRLTGILNILLPPDAYLNGICPRNGDGNG